MAPEPRIIPMPVTELYPPCGYCGSDGWPADIEITLLGVLSHLCLDCWEGYVPERVRLRYPVGDRAEIEALRRRPGSASYRNPAARGRQRGETPGGLVLP